MQAVADSTKQNKKGKKQKKILLDMNISPDLADIFNSRSLLVERAYDYLSQDANDDDIYHFAWANGYDAILVRDFDFKEIMEESLHAYRRINAAWRDPKHDFHVPPPPKLIRIKDQQLKKDVFLRLMYAFRNAVTGLLHRENPDHEFRYHYLCIKLENLSVANQKMVLDNDIDVSSLKNSGGKPKDPPSKIFAKKPVRRHHKPR